MTPSVTVLITCYNLEKYIFQTIQSALSQDYDGDLEIVVVDDCSTDGSKEAISLFPEVRYVHCSRNGGVLLAMVEGLEKSSSEIVCLLDGDDVWRPDKVRRTLECFGSDQRIGLVTHDLDFIDSEGRELFRTSRPEQVLANTSPDDRTRLVREGILLHGDYVWLGSALSFRRSIGKIDQFIDWARALPNAENTYQDWPLAFWIAALPGVVCDYIPTKLFSYRLHGSNHSGDASDPEKALRNLRRARNTADGMRRIALVRQLPEDIATEITSRVRFLDYVVDLYSGRSGRALRGFLGNLRYMRQHSIAFKELLRLVVIQTVGPPAFCRLASCRRLLRRMRPKFSQ